MSNTLFGKISQHYLQKRKPQGPKKEVEETPLSPAEAQKQETLAQLQEAYQLGRSSQSALTRRQFLAKAGLAAAATVAAAPLHRAVGRTAKNVYTQYESIRDFGKSVIRTLYRADVQETRRLVAESREQLGELETDLNRYMQGIESRERLFRDLARSWETFGAYATKAPGYNTKAVQFLAGIQDSIILRISELANREKQGYRIDPDYRRSCNELLKLTKDATERRNLTEKEIQDSLKKIGAFIETERGDIAKERESLQDLLEAHRRYQGFLTSYDKLDPQDIVRRTKPYQEALEQAQALDLQEYSPRSKNIGYGAMLASGVAGYLLAEKALSPVGRVVGRLLGRSKADARKLAEIAEKMQQKNQPANQGNLEGKVLTELTLFSLISLFLIFFFNSRITGNSIFEANTFNLSLTSIILILIIIITFLLSKKVYKPKKTK